MIGRYYTVRRVDVIMEVLNNGDYSCTVFSLFVFYCVFGKGGSSNPSYWIQAFYDQ